MLFNSWTFACLLIPTLLLYWASPWRTVRLLLLFAASMTFYSWYHWPSAFLLLFTIGINYAFGRALERRRSKALLAVAVTLNLSLLCWFKYAAFAADQLIRGFAWLGFTIAPPQTAHWLPLGISFFTFQVIAYQVDVYRRQIEAESSLLVLAVFKSFFAQLIAGPILRAEIFLPQLQKPRTFCALTFQRGMYLFIAGLCLKLAVADVLRQYADYAFVEDGLKTSEMWLGLYAYSVQLFADFWGYSTMAVGLGLMFGLDLPFNFNVPYIATSLQSFWRRWHITLSQWFRDYLYIPLGGSRAHTTRNLLVTMALAGLWHGAGWTFVLWGLLHGVWQAVERHAPRLAWPKPIKILLVFHGVALLWVLFRAPTLDRALLYYGQMLLPPYTFEPRIPEFVIPWLLSFAVLHPLLARTFTAERFERLRLRTQVALTMGLLYLSLAYAGQSYDFVYFAF